MISFSSSLRRFMKSSVKTQFLTLLYPSFTVIKKYAFARGTLNVVSILYQSFISGLSIIQWGQLIFDTLFGILAFRSEKSEGMKSFLEGKCKDGAISEGFRHSLRRDGEISSSMYRDPNHGSYWMAEIMKECRFNLYFSLKIDMNSQKINELYVTSNFF